MPKRIEHKWIDGIECKRCSKCKEYKPLDRFPGDKTRWDGLSYLCFYCITGSEERQAFHGSNKNRTVNGVQERRCGTCKQWRGVDCFYRRNEKLLQSTCIDCYSKRITPEQARGYKYKINYSISQDQYNMILVNQNGVCKVCKGVNKDSKPLYVDHDHGCCPGDKSCGKCIRGLLCSDCNFALGNAKDNIEILQSLIKYLQSYQKIEA